MTSFLVPALVVAAVILLLVRVQTGAETVAVNLSELLPFGFAFAAGMVASVNPCGFLMLPSYISYHLGTEEEGYLEVPAALRAGRALLLGAVATSGFVVVSGAIGLLISLGAQWLAGTFVYAGAAVGVVLFGLGVWLLVTGRGLGVMAASRVHVSPRRNLGNVFLFGMAYSVASLGCTLPIFLVVVGTSLSGDGLAASAGQFISYALGMGLVLMAVTLGAALFRGTVARWLRSALPHVHRISAMFLTGAGAYLVYYWLFYIS